MSSLLRAKDCVHGLLMVLHTVCQYFSEYLPLFIGTLEEANEQESLKVQSDTVALFMLCM